ncbi:MAG: peptidoglycan DD-metalloendopeptidase family protein [Cytophagaceae bacterium]
MDYYAFGMLMPGRTYNSQDYRYGFNGKEKDPEGMGGGGTTYDYGFRIYNPQIARFLSIDPRGGLMPRWSPYVHTFDNPILHIDIDGQIPWPLAGTKAVNKRDHADGAWGLKNTVVRTSTYQDTQRPKGASNPHIGIDYRAEVGTPFYSLGDGVVQAIGQTSRGAKYIIVEYANGDKIRFLHISSTAKGLKVGDKVNEGQYLGSTGKTGTKHPHLHVDGVNKDGEEIDPEGMNYGKYTAEEWFGDGLKDDKIERSKVMMQKVKNLKVMLEEINDIYDQLEEDEEQSTEESETDL